MSAKSLDTHGRWRSLTIAFRISPEDNEQLNRLAPLSGLTKQEYITQRLLCRDVIIQGNPRVYKAPRENMIAIQTELERIAAGESIPDDILELMQYIAQIMEGMKNA